jgi:diguanylate cyclase (GGDEF)-like protein
MRAAELARLCGAAGRRVRRALVLDNQTLLFSSTIAGYAYALIFGLTWLRRREDLHLLIWGGSLVCSSTGLLLALVSESYPLGYLTAPEGMLAYLLLGMNFALGWIGVRRFDGRTTSSPIAFLAGALPGLAYGALLGLGALPTHALAGMYAGLSLPAVLLTVELVRGNGSERLPSRTLAALAFAFYVVSFVVAAGFSLAAGPNPMAEAALESERIALIVDQICTILAYVGLLAMSGERGHAELERLAAIDLLTGLVNRRGLAAAAGRLLGSDRRPEAIAVLLLDIDRFKLVNDRYGHDGGDAVLVHFARHTQNAAMRSGDVLARYGGEEFVAVMPNTTLDQAVLVAERLRRAIATERFRFAGAEIHITVSIGVAAVAPEERMLEPAISRADAALYAAKQAGRNRVVA